jgi:hypothetical protein
MKLFLMLPLVLSFYFTTCNSARVDSNSSPSQKNEKSKDTSGKHYFIDVHDLEPGNVTLNDVAAAHQKHRATENKYDLNFIRFRVDERKGKVYCLSSAKDTRPIIHTHTEAHGLLASSIFKVSMSSQGNVIDGMPLFIDIHNDVHKSPNAALIEKAYSENFSVQKKYGINFINYWADAKTGTFFCLSQAPDTTAIIFAHREAHGLTPQTILEVKQVE